MSFNSRYRNSCTGPGKGQVSVRKLLIIAWRSGLFYEAVHGE